ncbi:hypothetical protein YDYSG_23230 [Paenibacillus tyrfis]|nr:hypothetical protein YDYSG_23230 [Paenibacillus tyrfis]GMX63682.1 hypothetical protein Elgi_02880 [Paenibacillus elgii]
MACDKPKCDVVLKNETFCYLSDCTSGGSSYPKTMGANKIVGCEDGSTYSCQQPRIGCCY